VGSDGVNHYPAADIGFGNEGQQDANAHVKAFKDKVANEQHGNQDKPDDIQIHD
jgi:hypothetical protein